MLVEVPNRERAMPLPLALAPPGRGVSITSVLPSQYIGVRSKVFSGIPQLVFVAGTKGSTISGVSDNNVSFL